MHVSENDVVHQKFVAINGEHQMTPADDEYCRRLFTPLTGTAEYSIELLLTLVGARRLPVPSYVLSDGTFMVHTDYHDVIRTAGGPDRLRAWFLAHWDPTRQDVAQREWDGYLSGQYVCLYSVTPDTIQAKTRLIEQIKAAMTTLDEISDDAVASAEARKALATAVDELDDLEPPFTAYDRLRFAAPLSREVWIDATRAAYLADDDTYRMTLSLNVLNHLGINLYSNLPAVLSEAVANAWDADATSLEVTIDPETETMVITDNGIGMTRRDINGRYLNVGYTRRQDERNLVGAKTLRGRDVMGRKGIGKLSLFSIAKTIEVQSVAQRPLGDRSAPLQRSAVVLDLDEIRRQITDPDKTGVYWPDAAEPDESLTLPGTRLTMTRPRKDLRRTAAHLRRRLARRFSMIADEFEIYVNGDPITPADRDLAKRCRYLWVLGPEDYRTKMKALAPGAERIKEHPGLTGAGRQIRGWIGSATTSTDLKPVDDRDETLNRIAVLVRGKLAQEDVLEGVAQGGIFTKFLSGEIHADFLDEDTKDDIATSSRQGIVEDDERFLDFRGYLVERIAAIGTDWNNFREEDGVKDAAKLVPAINDWINRFTGDSRKAARSFIGKVNSAAVDNDHRRQLLTSGVIAFERLHRRDRLSEITGADEANLPALIDAFKSIDDVEAAMYFDIVRQRLEIIRKFEELTEGDALESILQDYLFDHLWLLDPGWDRATESVMEKQIATLIGSGDSKDRVDIKYRTTGSSHVIVELKRAGRKVSTPELQTQTERYRVPVNDFLKSTEGKDVDVQVVCVVGVELDDWKNDGGRQRSRESLRAYSTRVVMYGELIKNAKQAYAEYLAANNAVGEVRDIIAKIEDQLARS